MDKLLDLIERFQNLKNITGTTKSSSYSVQLHFDPWSDRVQVEFGGYDVGCWSRHEYLNTTRHKLLIDMEAKIVEAESLVKDIDHL
jgi:hypothetical protein